MERDIFRKKSKYQNLILYMINEKDYNEKDY